MIHIENYKCNLWKGMYPSQKTDVNTADDFNRAAEGRTIKTDQNLHNTLICAAINYQNIINYWMIQICFN